MADEKPTNVDNNVDNQTEVTFNDPFDFSEDKQEDVLSSLEFNLDEDGEVQLEGLEEAEGGGEEETKETEEQKVSSEEVKEDEGYVTDPFEGQKVSPEVQAVLDRNKELEDRLAKLEGTVTESSTKEQLAKKESELRERYEEVGFTDNQIDVLLEDALAREAKILESKEKETEETEDEGSNQEQIGKEVGEVLEHYNGKNGRPSVEEMKPFVNYAYMRFGDSLKKYPIFATFRLGENAPFINWLDREFPDKMKELSIEQIFTASENLRKKYYEHKGKPISSYEHLKMVSKDNKERNNGNDVRKDQVSNEEVIRLSKEKEQSSRNVPGGEVETEEEINERRKPRSARETAELTLTSMMGGK